MDNSRRLLVAWAPAIAWAALIFVFSAQPDLRFVPDENIDLIVRKLGHAAVFGVLALLLWRAARLTSLPRPWALAFVLAAVYAVTDELHQAGVVGRNASAVDVGVDVVGATIALLGLRLIRDSRR